MRYTIVVLLAFVSSIFSSVRAEIPSPYPQILYWKWDDSTLVPGVVETKVDDICARSGFDTICISFHWMKAGYFDPRLQSAIRVAVARLAKHGRRLILDIDPRTEGDDFLKEYPGEYGGFAAPVEFDLDATGRGSATLSAETVHRFGKKRLVRPDGILSSWAFVRSGNLSFEKDSLSDITASTTCRQNTNDSTQVEVNAGLSNAGKHVLAYAHFTHVIPDLFSPNLATYVDKMFEVVNDLPIYGTAIDEWGISSIFHFDDRGLYFRESFISTGLEAAYERSYGVSLRKDLLFFRYGPQETKIRVANQYLATLRAGMAKNEGDSYRAAKHHFGKDAFVGTHPTWTNTSLEALQNGLNWWECPRDFGQTDEGVIIPVRLALAHKARGAVWYNMYYSNRPARYEGFFPETWTNARWGGRTHNLGYECPNEGICEFVGQGILEDIWSGEAEISKLNKFQKAAPDSRVLLLFGIEACTNWQFSQEKGQEFRDNQANFVSLMKSAQAIFDSGFLCDLVPSSELANGSIKCVNGKPTYGTQQYDAVVILIPEAMSMEVYKRLLSRPWGGTPLMIAGNARWLAEGTSASEAMGSLRKSACRTFDSPMETEEICGALRERGVPGNRFPNGCVLQDGSLIFTADATQPKGNPLFVDVVHAGHHIQFKGMDFLGIRIDHSGSIMEYKAGSVEDLRIDGKAVR